MADDSGSLILGFGDLPGRLSVIQKLGERFDFATVFHPLSVLLSDHIPGPGTFLAAQSLIGVNAKIGKHCIVNTAASIDHDCKIGNNVHIAPGVRLGGDVHVGDNTLIGTGAIINPGITVGANCQVGSGAVVTQNIPNNQTVIGIPAKPRPN